MSDLREAAQMALERLVSLDRVMQRSPDCDAAITALRAALDAPEPEPVAYVYHGVGHDNQPLSGPRLIWQPDHMDAMSASKGVKAKPLYTAPPQRTPLTDAEIDSITDEQWGGDTPIYAAHRAYARAVERAHGIGGSKPSRTVTYVCPVCAASLEREE